MSAENDSELLGLLTSSEGKTRFKGKTRFNFRSACFILTRSGNKSRGSVIEGESAREALFPRVSVDALMWPAVCVARLFSNN